MLCIARAISVPPAIESGAMSAAVSGWRVMIPALCSSDRSKPLEGMGVVFSRGKAPRSINTHRLAARDTPDVFQPARRRGLTYLGRPTRMKPQPLNPIMHGGLAAYGLQNSLIVPCCF
jgi:hypothetical protein